MINWQSHHTISYEKLELWKLNETVLLSLTISSLQVTEGADKFAADKAMCGVNNDKRCFVLSTGWYPPLYGPLPLPWSPSCPRLEGNLGNTDYYVTGIPKSSEKAILRILNNEKYNSVNNLCGLQTLIPINSIMHLFTLDEFEQLGQIHKPIKNDIDYFSTFGMIFSLLA